MTCLTFIELIAFMALIEVPVPDYSPTIVFETYSGVHVWKEESPDNFCYRFGKDA